MLRICCRLNEIDITQLFTVYQETIAADGRMRLPWGSEYEQVASCQQDFYEYLIDFLRVRGAFYALWVVDGQYQSALRVEPYRDGYLLCGLETRPECRRKGFASALVAAVLKHLGAGDDINVYAHVDKKNKASLAVHADCGFQIIADHAVYLDGSVIQSSYTLHWSDIKGATV